MRTIVFFLLISCWATLANASFTDHGDGTVTDNTTGLMWQKQNDASQWTWEGALIYCESLSLGGFTDWRLPSVKELSLLVDDSRGGPAINPVFTDTATFYWSSTSYSGNTTDAWYVLFGSGVTGYNVKNASYLVRCLRGM